ncbi:TadG family pilus assembly protein [Methylobacterium planeticum]|uniref:Uncharacterized protein n=1 Tax=Methylobacterium planeticum TaxID=2615211 RepID=A0A6N6MP06_9HYPH|nr:TadG family pilus assembly protein [Methylobacterium planeticum]KAB1072646.1 hypothetical protein F6X51_15285 [Methylobacterium planeticum]
MRPVLARRAQSRRRVVRARAPIRRLAADRQGGMIILAGAGFAVLFGFAGLATDLGAIVLARRQAQGAVDIAAMVAASNPAQAESLARRSLADNGYARDITTDVSPGRYRADPLLAPSDRFKPGAAPGNAIRVALRTSVRTHFGRFLGLPAILPVEVTGTAAQAQFAAFDLGSGTLSVDGGIANALLGALLGTSLSLSALDYDALLIGQVDTFRFLDALSVELGIRAGGYASVLQASASVGQIIRALRVAIQGEVNAAPTITALGTLLGNLTGALGSSTAVPIAQVVDLGAALDLSPGRTQAGPRTGLFNLISDAAVIANGQRQVSIELGANVAGLLSTRLTLAIGERRQSSGWAQPGSANASVSTAQTRLLIEVAIKAPLGLGSLSLPLYAELAPARATLRSLACPWSDQSERRVSVEAQPGLFRLAVAGVPRSAIAVGAATPDLRNPATLIDLPLVRVRASAQASLVSPAAQTLTFSDSDIRGHVTQSVTTTGLAQSLTGTLVQSLAISLDEVDLGLGLLLKPLLPPVIAPVSPVLDRILDSVFKVLGIRVGYADVTVGNTLCSRAALVQ